MSADASLLNASQEIFAPEMVKEISEAVGLSIDKTKKALISIVPKFTSDIIEKGNTFEESSNLLDIVAQGNDRKIPMNIDVRGINEQTTAKIISLISPVLMGTIRSKVERENLSAYGLMIYLKYQKLLAEGSSSETSEFYQLSGQDPLDQASKDFKIPWGAISLISLVLIVLWFWWNGLLIQTGTVNP